MIIQPNEAIKNTLIYKINDINLARLMRIDVDRPKHSTVSFYEI